MSSVQFIFGIHNHQPVGNFDFVFEEAYQKSYKPFIDVYETFSHLSLSIHISGCLLEWLDGHHPEYLDRIAALVKTGNLEIISAGFYEPVLAVIPDRDKRGQIRKLNNYIRERFHYEPEGLWLTERVWEPHLCRSLVESDIRYITVDDFHFLSAGKARPELTGYFMTEEQGFPVGVFPISQQLRYTMPFKEPEETIAYLKSMATEDGNNVIVMADDGEKFGVWPSTYERCFTRDKWLERFFRALSDNRDWLKTTTFKDYFHNNRPKGRVYLPTVSYFEMSEWTLPAEKGERFSQLIHSLEKEGNIEKLRPFLRGGTWRNFQSLYEESNWMQKRVVQTSNRLEAYSRAAETSGSLAEIRDDLWRAQCNCAYWHGVFGGLYLPHLRHAIYHHLLKAEAGLDNLTKPLVGVVFDIDLDGGNEYIMQSDILKIIVAESGGVIRELDYLPANFNLTNTMRRYAESYHAKVKQAQTESKSDGSIHDITLAKELGLENYLQVDETPRAMLVDHFLEAGTSLESMSRQIPEKGDFYTRYFSGKNGNEIKLFTVGKAFKQTVEISKSIRLTGGTVYININVSNRSDAVLKGIYGSELNFSLLGGHTPDRYYQINGTQPENAYLDVCASDSDVKSISVVNEWDQFEALVKFREETAIWRYPVFTVSMSESGFEKVYQSSVITPYWNLNLAPDETKKMEFVIKVGQWKKNTKK